MILRRQGCIHVIASSQVESRLPFLLHPNDMIQRCQRLVEGLLAFFILLVLHLIHSSTLILALFLHLFHHFGLSPTTTLSQDVSLWKSNKIPKSLGVIFVPAARGYFSLSKLRYKAWDDGIVYDGMKNDVIDLIKWSLELGVEELLLYDENGEHLLHERALLRLFFRRYICG